MSYSAVAGNGSGRTKPQFFLVIGLLARSFMYPLAVINFSTYSALPAMRSYIS
jgi:hypothetical protein